MRILHVITGLRRAAGTTTFCLRVSDVLRGLDHEVAVAVRREDPDGGGLVPKGAWEPGGPLPFRPDVVHIHGVWPYWLHRAQAWARREGIPVVLSPHGMLAPWAMAHKRWKKVLPWLAYQRGDVRRAALIHTTAEQETEWVRALGFRNPVAEVPLGTDLPSRLATHDGPVKALLFVGRIYPVKGLDLLLRAWALAKARGARWEWHLLLVGPDQAGHMAELGALAGSLGLTVRHGEVDGVGEADVTFIGPLYGADKDMAMRMARGLVLPSYTENFGGVVVDAMAFGLPVLTSSATPWRHLEATGCGRTFGLAPEALAELLTDFADLSDDRRKEMGRKGRRLVEARYTWEAVGRQMGAAYRRIAGAVGV